MIVKGDFAQRHKFGSDARASQLPLEFIELVFQPCRIFLHDRQGHNIRPYSLRYDDKSRYLDVASRTLDFTDVYLAVNDANQIGLVVWGYAVVVWIFDKKIVRPTEKERITDVLPELDQAPDPCSFSASRRKPLRRKSQGLSTGAIWFNPHTSQVDSGCRVPI